MPHKPKVSDETELGGFPRRLPDQEAVLIGVVRGESSHSGQPAYYLHGHRALAIGRIEEHEFVPSHTLECESGLMSECVQSFNEIEVETELSAVGESLIGAYWLANHTGFSDEQAHVFALRELAGFDRTETAHILNIAPTTVDTHFQRAKQKRLQAQRLVDFAGSDQGDRSSEGKTRMAGYRQRSGQGADREEDEDEHDEFLPAR